MCSIPAHPVFAFPFFSALNHTPGRNLRSIPYQNENKYWLSEPTFASRFSRHPIIGWDRESVRFRTKMRIKIADTRLSIELNSPLKKPYSGAVLQRPLLIAGMARRDFGRC
jgi:hypothetical protein